MRRTGQVAPGSRGKPVWRSQNAGIDAWAHCAAARCKHLSGARWSYFLCGDFDLRVDRGTGGWGEYGMKTKKGLKLTSLSPFVFMVAREGIEPPTLRI